MKVQICRLAFLLVTILSAHACLAGRVVRVAQGAQGDGSGTSNSEQSSGSMPSTATVTVPGPLRSFLRMAAISQKVSPEEILPLLARNVVVEGYSGTGRNHRPT